MNDESYMTQWNVSRETLERLQIFDATIRKWNPRINLVSRNSLDALWDRHINDSIQVLRTVKPGARWVDLGSGGGFPGLIAAIVLHDEAPETEVILVESDQRKSAFLRNAARECGVTCKVISDRIEKIEPLQADTLSARALASLDLLLEFTDLHLKKDGTAVFPKGATWKKELEDAQKKWSFAVETITSLTEPEAAILKINGVARV